MNNPEQDSELSSPSGKPNPSDSINVRVADIFPVPQREAPEKKMPVTAAWLRWTLLVGSGILCLHAFVYGPGRGITLIPPDDPLAEVLALGRLGVYVCFFLAAIVLPDRGAAAALLFLGVGLVGRCILELKVSVAKHLFPYRDLEAGWLILTVVFYFVSFVVPFLVFLDCRRALRAARGQKDGKLGA